VISCSFKRRFGVLIPSSSQKLAISARLTGTAAHLKPGMTVTVTLGTDPGKASRINATAK
jgi:hypothetical protein